MQSVPLPDALVISLGFVASGHHADVRDTEDHEWVSGPKKAKDHVDVYGPFYH